MDINKLMEISYIELRALYKSFLQSQEISKSTVDTAIIETFYLWRNGSKDLFWDVMTDEDFERKANHELVLALSVNSSGNTKSLASSYLSQLRKFRKFLNSDVYVNPSFSKKDNITTSMKVQKTKVEVVVPRPSLDQVEFYLKQWRELENYRLQEDALDKLFIDLCPENKNISDVLLKASTLNSFYSTNIFSIYPVAKHIHSLDIDSRLKTGDVTLVRDIQFLVINQTPKNFYSFATKYCSHHNPTDYPIYDSYVDKIFRYFKNLDGFSDFQNHELKDYIKFKNILIEFRSFYGLEKYNLKQIDQYVWQLGKEYFPNNYKKKHQEGE